MITAALALVLLNPTSTGRHITPIGRSVEVGGFPVNAELSPDGKFIAVVNGGTTQNLSILSAATGKIVSQKNYDGKGPNGEAKDGLYFGVRFVRDAAGKTLLFTSHGAGDRADAQELSPEGKLVGPVTSYRSQRPLFGTIMPTFFAGLAISSDASSIYAVGNQSFALSDYEGSIHRFAAGNPKPTKSAKLPGFPLDAVILTKGPSKDKKLYVSCERDGIVAVVDAETLAVIKTIPIGEQPTHLLLDAKQENLYVAASNSDQIAVIDTRRDVRTDTILVRPAEQRGLPGAAGLGMSLSPGGETLYIALADLNAVGVVDLKARRLIGLIPTAWYPTDVIASGKNLFAVVAKGSRTRVPNLPPKDSSRDDQINGDSGPNIRMNQQGIVTRIGLPTVASLAKHTQQVLKNNFLSRISRALPKPPAGIKHVVYIVKENRTYDQFFGGLKQGNGRPDLVLYDRSVIPNQTALAERFVLLDNFYACAEMSADGWSWATAGITSEYVQRNAQYEYSGHKREYDYEGQNNGTPADARGMRNVNTPPGGYIWDNALRHGKEFRNYGMYIAAGVPVRDKEGRPIADDNSITMRAFEGRFDPNFRMYDMDYAESDAWELHGKTYPKHRRTFGANGAKSRVEAWRTDYARLIKEDKVPPLMLVRFGNNHTAGTTPGSPTPTAMIADNDFALGQLVETISKGPKWKETCIVVVEDDAQGGYDHVDGHRSICFVISPYVKKATVSSHFYNTDSALRTVEWLLGMKPANQFMATAEPIACFGAKPLNDAPYEAILQKPEIYRENLATAYRAADSARLFHTYREESAPDRELADILWGDAKGAKSPRPKVIGQKVISPYRG